MVVEETVGDINGCLINLQLTVEHIACQMEVGMNALPHRQNTTAGNEQTRNHAQLTGHPKGPRFEGNNSETSNEAQNALKNYRLKEPIDLESDSDTTTDEEDGFTTPRQTMD